MSDIVVRNARIWSPGGVPAGADTAIVRDGVFVFVGHAHDANPPASTRTIDAASRRMLPGFTDAHAHLLGTGAAMNAVNLKGVTTVDEAIRRVAERASTLSAGTWIRGAGWDQHLWPAAAFPDRRSLDAVAPAHPVVLTHTSGHCIWVNSVALRKAAITSATVAPAGGSIDIDEHDDPTGILRDSASRLVQAVVPSPSSTERIAILEAAIAHAHSVGVTGVHAMDVGRGEWKAMCDLREHDALRLRVRAFLSAARLDDWIDAPTHTGDGDDVLRVGGVKFFADGALGSMTAWMREPYEGTSDTGIALQPPEELEARVRRCLEAGLAPAIHAIGDRANRETLDILERTRGLAPHLPRRIEHAQLLAPDDIARFGALGVTASVQPIHATQDMAKVDRFWRGRGEHAYAFASLLATGANLAFGSDSPVETMDPIAGLHAAVTRRNAAGEPSGGWYPDERISLEAALTAYTAGCAKAVREDASLGRIAPNYAADFVLLSEDPLGLDDPMRILDCRVDMTVVAGEVVFERR